MQKMVAVAYRSFGDIDGDIDIYMYNVSNKYSESHIVVILYIFQIFGRKKII
jgi:hypothetical protein